MRRDGDGVLGRCTLRAAHEGPPGRSHGGVVAAVFDDLFGFVLTVNQLAAFTGELSIRYRAGAPLFEPLELRAWMVGRERRKLFIEGEGSSTHGVFATATATFIVLPGRGHLRTVTTLRATITPREGGRRWEDATVV